MLTLYKSHSFAQYVDGSTIHDEFVILLTPNSKIYLLERVTLCDNELFLMRYCLYDMIYYLNWSRFIRNIKQNWRYAYTLVWFIELQKNQDNSKYR